MKRLQPELIATLLWDVYDAFRMFYVSWSMCTKSVWLSWGNNSCWFVLFFGLGLARAHWTCKVKLFFLASLPFFFFLMHNTYRISGNSMLFQSTAAAHFIHTCKSEGIWLTSEYWFDNLDLFSSSFFQVNWKIDRLVCCLVYYSLRLVVIHYLC